MALRASRELLVLLSGTSGIFLGCDRGCQGWAADRGSATTSPITSGVLPLNAADCPDGLARCADGVVSVSRLATLPMPCHGPPGACTCPWEWAAQCPSTCAADGVELVVERLRAERQLCAPAIDAGPFATPAVIPLAVHETPCEEGDRYRCSRGQVIECSTGLAVGLCVRGCFAEGTAMDDDAVSREAAFAILCSR
jgi:hypothetical protein